MLFVTLQFRAHNIGRVLDWGRGRKGSHDVCSCLVDAFRPPAELGNKSPMLLSLCCRVTCIYTAVSRKVVVKKRSHVTIPKGIVGSFKFTVP